MESGALARVYTSEGDVPFFYYTYHENSIA